MRVFLRTLLLLAMAPVAQAQDRRVLAPEATTTAVVPDGWRAQQDPNWEGTKYVSPQGESSLVLYSLRRRQPSVEAHIRWFSALPGERVTYRARGRGWIVVSGFKQNGRIFYRKALLACNGRVWQHLSFEYPTSRKRAFDRLVTRTSHSLRRHGCD